MYSKKSRASRVFKSYHSRGSSGDDRPAKRSAFDHESGVVYTEYEISAARKGSVNWINEVKNSSLVRRTVPNENGARSLQAMAITACIKELRNLTSDHLAFVPWTIAEAMWQKVKTDHCESLHIWRIFASSYGSDFANRQNRYMVDIKSPELPLTDYYHGITSIPNHWLTALRISPKQVAVPDLIGLANISNLTVLDLSDGQRYVEDRISNFEQRVMRTWSELAASGRAFQHLRVLLLGWQEHLDTWIFDYLSVFPRLESILVTDCRNLHQRNRKEWELIVSTIGWEALHAKKSVKTLRPLLNDADFYVGNISSCYYESLARSEGLEEEIPILECWLGSPKPWHHIIDDFPSTRTIWFQRKALPSLTTDRSTPFSQPVSTATMHITGRIPSEDLHIRDVRKPKLSKQNTSKLLADFGI